MKNNRIIWWQAIVAVLLLIAFRAVAKSVFYDPFIAFFHDASYMQHSLPEVDVVRYGLSVGLRFAANSLLSLWLIYALFGQTEYIRVALLFMGLVFGVLFPVLLWFAGNANSTQYLYLFYTRRMLIHPLPVMLLIPAFYFHRIHSSGK